MGIPWRIATSLNNLGALQAQMGDSETAQATLEEALAIRREIGDRRAVLSTLNNLAALANHRGDFAAAVQGQQEALMIARELEDRSAAATNLVNLGQNFLSLHDYPAAYACFTESLQLHTAAGSRFGQVYALESLALHAVLTGCAARAGLLKGAAHSLRQAIQAEKCLSEQQQFDATFLPLAADPHFLEGVKQGGTLPLEASLSLAALPALEA